MGSIYRRKWKDKSGNIHESETLWIKYYRDGKPMRESAETTKEGEAKKLLKSREGDTVHGVQITPKIARIRFSELCDDMVNDFRVSKKKSLRDLDMRLRRHILPAFGHRRAASISTADINKFILQRQEAGASNGEINRELTHIKRAFSLAMEATPRKVLQKPHIPMLEENNIRTGFLDPEQFAALRGHFPARLQRLLAFAYITGWRIPSEVLTLRWPQIRLDAGTVSLEPGTTKNKKGRVFPFTDELRAVLEEQRAYTDKLQKKLRVVVPWVFHHEDGTRIAGFRKAWARACYRAGLPCQVETETRPDGKVRIKKIQAANIPHDFRRSAIRNLIKAGVPEAVAMKLSGHETRSVFDRYHIVSETDLHEAAHRLNDFLRNGTTTGTNPGTVAVSAVKAKR